VQNTDGGFGSSPGDDSGAEMTGWAMLGLEAADRNPLDVARGGQTPVDFLRGAVGELKSPGDLARTIVALEGAGVDPRKFAGANLVSQLLARRRDNGSFEDWPGTTAFAVIALRTAGASGGLEKSLSWLNEVQNEDGGWGDVPGSPSTADGTGAAMQALSPDSKAVRRGISYLREAQRPGGGYPLGGNGAVNTQSTAWAIQGILAAGGDLAEFRRGGAGATEYLVKHQKSDGHYRYSGASDQTPVWVTGQVIVAAAETHYPVPVPPRAPQPKLSQANSTVTGGVPPSTVGPSPDLESPIVSPSESSGGNPGFAPGHSGSSGQGAPGQSRSGKSPGIASGGVGAPAPGEASASGEPTEAKSAESAPGESKDNSSAAGAVAVGVLAGALLFGVAWASRKAWMRQRYGV
jgi:hypothetical protein